MRFRANMNLVFATFQIKHDGHMPIVKTVHGLVHVSMTETKEDLKAYADDLTTKESDPIVYDLMEKHNIHPENVKIELLDFGLVVPCTVDLPQGGCEEEFSFTNMEFDLKPVSGVVMDDLETHNICEV